MTQAVRDHTAKGVHTGPSLELVVAYDNATDRIMIVSRRETIRRETIEPESIVASVSVRVDSRSRQLQQLRALLKRFPYRPTAPAGSTGDR